MAEGRVDGRVVVRLTLTSPGTPGAVGLGLAVRPVAFARAAPLKRAHPPRVAAGLGGPAVAAMQRTAPEGWRVQLGPRPVGPCFGHAGSFIWSARRVVEVGPLGLDGPLVGSGLVGLGLGLGWRLVLSGFVSFLGWGPRQGIGVRVQTKQTLPVQIAQKRAPPQTPPPQGPPPHVGRHIDPAEPGAVLGGGGALPVNTRRRVGQLGAVHAQVAPQVVANVVKPRATSGPQQVRGDGIGAVRVPPAIGQGAPVPPVRPPQEGVQIAGSGPFIRLKRQQPSRRLVRTLEPPSGRVRQGPPRVVPISRRPKPLRVALGPLLPLAARAVVASPQRVPLAVRQRPKLGKKPPARVGAVPQTQRVRGRVVGTGPRAPQLAELAAARLAAVVRPPIGGPLPGEEVIRLERRVPVVVLRRAQRTRRRPVQKHGTQVQQQRRVLAAPQAVPSVLPLHAPSVLGVPLQVLGAVHVAPSRRAGLLVCPPAGRGGRYSSVRGSPLKKNEQAQVESGGHVLSGLAWGGGVHKGSGHRESFQ